MADNYPAGVDSNHPHFNEGDGPRESPLEYELKYWRKQAEKWRQKHENDVPHDPDCKCEECECPF